MYEDIQKCNYQFKVQHLPRIPHDTSWDTKSSLFPNQRRITGRDPRHSVCLVPRVLLMTAAQLRHRISQTRAKSLSFELIRSLQVSKLALEWACHSCSHITHHHSTIINSLKWWKLNTWLADATRSSGQVLWGKHDNISFQPSCIYTPMSAR